MNNVSVIIPAHNEEKSIKKVIDSISKSVHNLEVIVIDNCSNDNTFEVAQKCGAKVYSCTKKGKGYAMEMGLEYATNEILVFIDADIITENNIIDILVEPIIDRKVDFVKSTFDRINGGIVTEIVTKPLLNILYPEMYNFSEPLSGMIASKKSVLEKIRFEKDYGVDIGILLDVIKMKLKVEEVNIGRIENMSHLNKTTQIMKDMSIEIMKCILKKSKFENNL